MSTSATPFPPPDQGCYVDDGWAHRSKGMRCVTCMWFVSKKPPEGQETAVPLGRCRRHAPTLSGFPVVFPTDWCGDHKLSEAL